jgi:hypothetical protein
MHFSIYDIFYSPCSHHHISTDIRAIFRVTLLQEYKRTNVANCVTITP